MENVYEPPKKESDNDDLSEKLSPVFKKVAQKWKSILTVNEVELSIEFENFINFVQSDFQKIYKNTPYFKILLSEQIKTLDGYFYHNIDHIIFMIFGYYVMKDIYQEKLRASGFLGKETDQIMILSILIHDSAIPVFTDLDGDEKTETCHEELAVERLQAIANLFLEGKNLQIEYLLSDWDKKMFVAVSQIVMATKMNFSLMKQSIDEARKETERRKTLSDLTLVVILCIELICDLDMIHLSQDWGSYVSSEQKLRAEFTRVEDNDSIRFSKDSFILLSQKYHFLSNQEKFGSQRKKNRTEVGYRLMRFVIDSLQEKPIYANL